MEKPLRFLSATVLCFKRIIIFNLLENPFMGARFSWGVIPRQRNTWKE